MYEDEEVDITQLRYFLYARKSTDDAKKQVRSIPDQITECLVKADRLGLNVINRNNPAIEKKSAKKPGIRPVFSQMLTDLRKSKFDAILAWHPDRLSRNMKEGGDIIDMIDEGYIVDLQFITHHFTNDANGKMLLGLAFVLSKQYSDDLSQKVKRGVKRKFLEQGFSPAYKHGYKHDNKGRYVPDGKNFELIKYAWEKRASGAMSLKDISEYMNSNGYRRVIKIENSPDKSVDMDKRILSKLFKDSFYYGLLTQAGMTVDLREKYSFKPAVTEDDFFKVQRLTKSLLAPVHTRKALAFYPLKKILLCEFCGSVMYIAPSTSSSRTKFLTANCQNKYCLRRKSEYKGKRTCRMNVVFNFIYDLLGQGIDVTDEDYKRYLEASKGLTARRLLTVKERLNIARGQLKKVKGDIKERSLQIIKFDPESTVYKENEQEVIRKEEEGNKLEEEIKRLEFLINKNPQEVLSLEQFSNLLNNAERVVKAGTAYQKDIICRYIFSNIWIGDNKVTRYSLKPPFDILLKDPKEPVSRGGQT